MNGFDVYERPRALRGQFVHTHAKDARRAASRGVQEVPLGHGDIDWLRSWACWNRSSTAVG